MPRSEEEESRGTPQELEPAEGDEEGREGGSRLASDLGGGRREEEGGRGKTTTKGEEGKQNRERRVQVMLLLSGKRRCG